MVSSLDSLVKNLGKHKLHHVRREFGGKTDLISRKDVYPYDWMDCFDEFSETELPMFEKGIRGGISMITKRHGEANNPYMGEEFDLDTPTKYLAYLDANNRYGWAMCNTLPVRRFEWMSNSELKDWKNHPCVLEVDLGYPKELHGLHNDYPLAPERLKIGGVEKPIKKSLG